VGARFVVKEMGEGKGMGEMGRCRCSGGEKKRKKKVGTMETE
jgi:hypothetical protein